MFASKSGEPERVAEFRWSASSGVTVDIFDGSAWGRLARQYYEQGIPDYADMRLIPRSDGEMFMRALAASSPGSYYSFVVESSTG
ncbi:hypothetical protein [Nocardia brevicatena]|uniref:hypothetical protein n=1 Tax=Nocardia brevicatena TaxID=37327 RepID=UPI0005931E5B|nr:hypothetical protein [Nocardia brevicatena]